MNKRKILATAALPYANGPIHIGHLVEYLQADFWIRFQKMRGHEALYICADDTHGTPIMVRARDRGQTPEQLIAEVWKEHDRDFRDFGVAFDHFSSTHSDENRILAERIYLSMQGGGHIDLREIEQLYCTNDKMFLPDRFVKGTCPNCKTTDQWGDSCDHCGATYQPRELIDARCSVCGTTPIEKKSSHVFFKLENFHSDLAQWVPQHTSPEISNKLQEWLAEPLRDWDISRDAPYFGFEIPGLKQKYFYVWLDAPIGYISSTWQWCKKNGRQFEEFWQNEDAELYHFIGKDIVYFHCLFWPAMLKSAGFRRPKQVFVHGFLTVNGEKMSKSKGTLVVARTYLNHLDPSYLRYYYACKLSGHLHDLDLSVDDFVNRVNSDLVGKITNLGSRGAQMLKKRLGGQLCALKGPALELVKLAQSKQAEIAEHYERRDFSRAIIEIRALADEANRYFDERAPWKLISEDQEATREVLSAILNVFRLLALYLKPVLPAYADRVADLLKQTPFVWADAERILQSGEIGEYEHLANRIEPAKVEAMMQESKAQTAAKSAEAATVPAQPAQNSGEIEFDEFAKVDLRVARILEAEEIKEADKLIRLRVDLGELGQRQIIAGIRSAYDAKDLVGRLTAVVANLKPRKMKFGVSEGMVLAAGPGGKDLFILTPDSGAAPGQKIK